MATPPLFSPYTTPPPNPPPLLKWISPNCLSNSSPLINCLKQPSLFTVHKRAHPPELESTAMANVNAFNTYFSHSSRVISSLNSESRNPQIYVDPDPSVVHGVLTMLPPAVHEYTCAPNFSSQPAQMA